MAKTKKKNKKQMRRKQRIFCFLLVIFIIIAASCAVYSYYNSENGASSNDVHSSSLNGSSNINGGSESDSSSLGTSSSSNFGDSSGGQSIYIDEMQIHFLQLGNKVSGDCTLIKVGDTEVLIDAGSSKGSAATTVPYIKEYCTDGVLEYVVATHAHEDHIAAFVGSSTADGVFESFECSTIIDFAKTTVTSQLYKDYVSLREAEVEAGATHYTALECWNNENGAQRSYSLGSGVTMNILYQKYYVESTSNENNNSVCILLTQGENNFLFTGDLESSGESSLVDSNELPKCKLYKAGHHGSNTSSSAKLIAAIQPEIVVISCCCGDKHAFPHQETLETISVYTDQVYVPVAATSSGYELLNGNIVVTSKWQEVTVNCSNNNILFKDTDWFKNNRTTPDAWLTTGG